MVAKVLLAALLWGIAALSLCCLVNGEQHDEDKLIGWKGETYKPKVDMLRASSLEINAEGKPWIQVISWKPRAFVYHNFLSRREAAHLLRQAAPQMKRSMVEGPNHTGVVDNIRTSAGTFLRRNQDEVITAIEQRLAVWSQLPPSHQEDLQVLRYGPTNKYGAHLDGLGRVMSVLIYLVAPEAGGETAFPNADDWLHPEMATSQGELSECAKGHVAYKPKVGDALLFFDRLPDYLIEDHFSEHTGCPVVKGVKWNAVKWIHGKPFREEDYLRTLTERPEPARDPGLCTNTNSECERWAKLGECDKNPGYMWGGGDSDGQGECRKSCGKCTVCKGPQDVECIKENRRLGNFINYEPEEFGPLMKLVKQSDEDWAASGQ